MWIIGLLALVVSIVALARIQGLRDAIRGQQTRLDSLARDISRIKELFGHSLKEPIERPLEQVEEQPLPAVEEQRRREVPVAKRAEVPVLMPETTAAKAKETAPQTSEPKLPSTTTPTEPQKRQPLEAARSLLLYADREKWARLEEKLGKQWTTWTGAVALIFSAAFFIKYAFEHQWLGERTRVILGVAAGLGVIAGGRSVLKRNMQALGQGLVGAGLAILYVSLYASYGFYELLGQPITFTLMAIVTTGGVAIAVVHDAIAISFLAIFGGFLTPVLLSTGRDARDVLFAYLLLLDLSVLAVAFFKRWRALDVLAFVGTCMLFGGWYFKFRHAPTYSTTPTMLWLAVFYLLFLIQPFVYHLRLATPIVGERFFLAVSNAAGMFGLTYSILHADHKHALGLVTLGMSVLYLILGSLTRKRLRDDERAVFGFIALSVMFLTIAIPIHLDFHGVTIAWAVKAPILLYLGYKYSYFPVRAGVLIPLALAAGRIFTTHWPLHDEAFTPLLNPNFGTAIFVALAGGAYAMIHHWQRQDSSAADQKLKVSTGIASAFLALAVMNIEVWQWLDLSGRDHAIRWACAFVCTAEAVGFLVAGIMLRSVESRLCGFVALAAAGALETWDYTLGIQDSYLLIFNGRFLATLATIAAVFAYALVYRRPQGSYLRDEKNMSIPLFGAGIVLLVVLLSFETWQWLVLRDHRYLARCLLPVLWGLGSAGFLTSGLVLRSIGLRQLGLAVLTVAGFLAAVGYGYRIDSEVRLCINGCFAAALTVPLLVFGYAVVLTRQQCLPHYDEPTVGKVLYGIGTVLLWVLLSTETYLYFRQEIADPQRSRWIAQMWLSVLWGIYAIAMLVIGFWRGVRSLRLAALGLFGLTAIKLVLVDMAQVEEVYRIVSFFVLGILIISASYLYHRVEKHLAMSSTKRDRAAT